MDVGSNADAHAALERLKKMKRPALLISVAILGLILFSISLPAFASWKKERRALNRVPRNFVVCLQLDETSPLQSENGREFFMKLSFEKVRNSIKISIPSSLSSFFCFVVAISAKCGDDGD